MFFTLVMWRLIKTSVQVLTFSVSLFGVLLWLWLLYTTQNCFNQIALQGTYFLQTKNSLMNIGTHKPICFQKSVYWLWQNFHLRPSAYCIIQNADFFLIFFLFYIRNHPLPFGLFDCHLKLVKHLCLKY